MKYICRHRREAKCISNPFATQHQKEVGGQHHTSAVLPPRKTQYFLYRWLGGTRSPSERHGTSRLYRDSIPGPFSLRRVSMPTQLSWLPMFRRTSPFKGSSTHLCELETRFNQLKQGNQTSLFALSVSTKTEHAVYCIRLTVFTGGTD